MTQHLSHDPQYHYMFCRDGIKIPCMCSKGYNHHEEEIRPKENDNG